jgi:endonuclease III
MLNIPFAETVILLIEVTWLNIAKEIYKIKSNISKERTQKRAEYEDKAKSFILENMNSLTIDSFDSTISLMNTDFYRGKLTQNRFYPLFSTPQRNMIRNNKIDQLEALIVTAFKKEDLTKIDEITLNLRGIKYGAASLFLYIKNKNLYNVFIPSTAKGLSIAYPEKANSIIYDEPFKENYLLFNSLCNELKQKYSISPQELDIILTVLGKRGERARKIAMKKASAAEFKIEKTKAVKIGEKLLDESSENNGVLKKSPLLEHALPRNLKKGSKEHALFLTYVISIDYLIDPEKLWKKSKTAYELFPERFTPQKILKIGMRSVQAFVKALGARFTLSAAEIWISLSQVLMEKYSGDPRNITPQPSTVEEIKKRIMELPSLRGPKMSNYYIRMMGEQDLFKIKNLNELEIPVDKQVAKFTMCTGILKLVSDQFTGCIHDEPLRNLIEEAWRDAAKTLSTAPWKLEQPIVTTISKFCSNKKCEQCPIENLCDKTKGIKFKNNTVTWRKTGSKS